MTSTILPSHLLVSRRQTTDPQRPAMPLADGGDGGFAAIVAGRGALCVSSGADRNGRDQADPAQGAREFGALALFRKAADVEQEAVAYQRQAVSPPLAREAAEMSGPGPAIVPVCEVSSEPDARNAPEAGMADPGPDLDVYMPEAEAGTAGPPHGAPRFAAISEPAAKPEPYLSGLPAPFGTADMEDMSAGASQRKADTRLVRAAVRQVELAVSIGIDGAEIIGRIADLAPDEERELDRRVRAELGSHRVGIRGITINGRDARPAGGARE